MNAMKCSSCKNPSHVLTWISAGVWHCPDCRKPKGYACIRKFDSAPPAPGTMKLVGFGVAFVQRPDYSRN